MMPWRPNQLWQQVFLAEILAWDTSASVSIPCIQISAPNISYPVVIQGLPQFSHTNDKKYLKLGQNPFLPHFSKSLFTNLRSTQCYTVCSWVTINMNRTNIRQLMHILVWFGFGLMFYKVRLSVSILMTETKVIHTASLNFQVAFSHCPLNTMLLH
jgi:hypothetical protein